MDKILEHFIKNPETDFYVREIAKKVKKSPTTVSRYLKRYEKEGLLSSQRKFHHLLFRANSENVLFKDLKLHYNLRCLRKSGLITYLIKQYKHPEAIVLFGSYQKAENVSLSDIDLLVISSLKKDVDLKKFEKKLGSKIQLLVRSNVELKAMRIKNKHLLNNLLNGFVVEGYWEVFF